MGDSTGTFFPGIHLLSAFLLAYRLQEGPPRAASAECWSRFMKAKKTGTKGAHGAGSVLTNQGASLLHLKTVGQSPTHNKATDQIRGVQPETRLKNMCKDHPRDRNRPRESYSMA